ncbi:MAG: hypothetical protein KKC84_02820, partial [Candidatus Omnitrophica bacterium]|nr:hypothetical protein [Candidatus Omnitrophota bacterium]
MDLKSQIEALVGLQTVDSEIYSLKLEKEAKPQEIKSFEEEFESKKAHLAELEKSFLELQKQKKEQELALGSQEENAKKLQNQLYSLKTNKEYQTMLQQIQEVKADASRIEDGILETLDKIDQQKSAVEKEKTRLEDDEKVFLEKKRKAEERLKEIDQRLAQLDAQRTQASVNVDQKIFTQYERILQNRDGLAIVSVAHSTCHGCNMLV